jgi:hypothetical protein
MTKRDIEHSENPMGILKRGVLDVKASIDNICIRLEKVEDCIHGFLKPLYCNCINCFLCGVHRGLVSGEGIMSSDQGLAWKERGATPSLTRSSCTWTKSWRRWSP